MKTRIYVIAAFIGFLMLCDESEDMNQFFLTKIFGLMLFIGSLYLSGALTASKKLTNKYKKQA